jgi:Nucleoside-diphosphate-sugar epimerases
MKKVLKHLGNINFDAILHFAGQSSGEISFDNPSYDLRTNTESTLRLINFALNNDCQRFIYASSMSVYGNVIDEPINEGHSCTPLSFYGVGKLASEHYLRIYQSQGLKPTSLRIFNVYGPGQNLSNLRQGMISIYLAQLLKNNKIIVKGAPDRFRDFIYIDDVVKLTSMILNENKSIGKIYNIGTGVRTSVNEVLEKLKILHDKEIEINFTDPTLGDQLGITADISLLKKDYDIEKFISLDDGLGKIYNWAKNEI